MNPTIKFLRVADVREPINLWIKEEISYSRMVEMLNEKATERLSEIGDFDTHSENYADNTFLDPNTYRGDVVTAFASGMLKHRELVFGINLIAGTAKEGGKEN